MTRILILLLLSASITLAQSLPDVNFRNDTPSDSPVMIDGTAKINYNQRNQQHFCCVKVHNPGQGLTAYVLELEMAGLDGKAYTLTVPHDHFLADDVAPLTGDFQVKFPCEHGTPTTLKLTFAQLEDGTMWGEDPAKQLIMAARADAQQYLTQLHQAYINGGSIGLQQLLEQKITDAKVNSLLFRGGDRLQVGLIQYELLQVAKKDGIEAVAALVDKRLSATQAHATWIKAVK